MTGRRHWPRIAAALAILVAGGVLAIRGQGAAPVDKMIVLGFDGLDPALTSKLITAGRLPSFARLAREGHFQPLGTSAPVLSPVAWSNFITGLDSGGHGIYDFMHRDPDTMVPYLSTSLSTPGERVLKVGRWQIPLEGGKLELMRRGTPFWEPLEAMGIETWILRMPANFPPTGTATRELSGMGTPDIHGTYGIFSYYTSELFFDKRDVAGGAIYELDYWDNVARGELVGPANPFRTDGEKVKLPFQLYVDPEEEAAKLAVGDHEVILLAGEWSDWLPLQLDLVPSQALHAEARFFLRRVRPEVEIYVTPLNFDPLQLDSPISTPPDYATELAEATGRFYTQGMPEDTQALRAGVLSRDEFLAQAAIAHAEVERQYDWLLERFDEGLFFYYFSNTDLVSHMMWRATDPEHPSYDAERDAPYAGVVESLYVNADAIVGRTLAAIDDDTTLVVMSDHGFASWRRAFNLNSWLRDNGYLAVKNPDLANDPGLFLNVDWSGTRAYGLGLNGLYVNLRGRERNGVVDPADRERLIDELAEKLLAVVDPATGQRAITRIYKRDEFYRDQGQHEIGPDIVVGYAKGTGGANESALGELTPEVFFDNDDEWSGDHRMDHTTVPGILFANRKLRKPVEDLRQLAGAIVAEFGGPEFPQRGEGR